MPTKRRSEDRDAAHWRRLGLLPGAPDCVIKAAHRHLIEIHHPDRGGSLELAQRVNVAADEVRGRGLAPNEHVATNYNGEPWHVLGLMATAEPALVERAGRALASELSSHPRLAARVEQAISEFGRPARAPAPPMPRPSEPARRAGTRALGRPREPATAGKPEGLAERIDLGTVGWASDVSRDLRLTWKQFAPYRVEATAPEPLRVVVKGSKALPGRFIVSVAVDWESPELSGAASLRGYTLDAPLQLRWGGGGEAVVRVRGVLLYPAVVSARPMSLDLGTVRLGQAVRASIMLISSAPADVTVAVPPWLVRVDGAGHELNGDARLQTNTPVRVAFDVDWEPIREKGSASIAARRAVRPTGKIVVRWGAPPRELEVPVQMVAETAPPGR
jgi:hypothetical protein